MICMPDLIVLSYSAFHQLLHLSLLADYDTEFHFMMPGFPDASFTQLR